MSEFFKLLQCVFFQHTQINSENTDRLPYKFHSLLWQHQIPQDKSSVSQDLSTSDDTPKSSLLPELLTLCVCVCVCVFMLSQVPLFGALWTVAHQAPLSTEFPRQEYWSGLPFPPPFRTQGSNQASCISCISRQILYPCAAWEAVFLTNWLYIGGSRDSLRGSD